MSRNTKTLIIIGLCVSILGLTVGYAALSSVLNITGTAKTGTLATNWNIKFKNASCEKVGYAIAGNITTEGTSLTLSDSVLVSPSDEVICTFDVVNEGTIDAEVTSVTVPNINKLTHGSNFITEQYNGYFLSYLAVKYMNETITHEKFIEIIKDHDTIINIGNNILPLMIDYYKETNKKNIIH